MPRTTRWNNDLEAEVRSMSQRISRMDECTTVELGCLCYIVKQQTKQCAFSANDERINRRMLELVSTYLDHDEDRLKRVTRVVAALERSNTTFQYLQSLPG